MQKNLFPRSELPNPASPEAAPGRQSSQAPGFDTKLYELITQHRLPDNTRWTLGYFAALVGTTEDQVRAWVAGDRPKPGDLARIEEALMVDGSALLRGEVKPMTLPVARRTTGEHRAIAEDASAAGQPVTDMGQGPSREARLRPAARDRYPDITADWEAAATRADQVLAKQLEEGAGLTVMRDRPLKDEHFEFRGGTEKDPDRLTRSTDAGG